MDFNELLDVIKNYVKEHFNLLDDLVKGVIEEDEYDDQKYGIDLRYSEWYPELFHV